MSLTAHHAAALAVFGVRSRFYAFGLADLINDWLTGLVPEGEPEISRWWSDEGAGTIGSRGGNPTPRPEGRRRIPARWSYIRIEYLLSPLRG
jgi:hypothetical protein